MPTDRRRRKEDQGISPFMDPSFRRASVYFDDIEYQRRFEQNLIRYGILSKAQVTKEITTAVGGGGSGGGGWCYWTKEGSNLVYYGGNVGVGVHPHSNDFEVRGNVLVESKAEQPYVEIRNWSDTEYDPVIHWSLGASPVKKYTMGVDDSDSDAWLLCSGDILTSVVTAASYTMNRAYDGNLLVVDTSNDRLKKHLSADAMTYVSKIGSTGTGDDNFDTPQAICNDGTYLYICDRANQRIVKRKVSDLSYVAKTGSLGAGVNDFNNPWGICTDGTYLYITDRDNNRVKKHLCSDLSYVALATVASSSEAPIGPHDFNSPRAICTDGTYLYITQNGGIVARLVILFCSTLSDVLHIHDDGHIDNCELIGICVTGGYLYIINMNSTDVLKHVYKYTTSILSYVTHWGVYGTGVGQMTTPLAIDTDGTTLWIFDYAIAPDGNRLMKFLLDGTYVATYGGYGSGDTQFNYACGLSLGGSISFTTTLYRAPILKAGLDGSYCDSYPLFRARDGFQLMEDGTVAATAYVGLYAPAAITASYSLTFPGTGPAAAGHFAVSAAGLITWGQDVNSTASPTFVGLTLSGLTASHPVFTDGTSVLVSTGTVPVDHGGTGLAVYAIGDLIYASATTTLARLADVAVASYLRSGGVTTAPLWSTLKLPNAATAYRLPVATSANTIGELAAVGATGEYLAGATGAIPAWATLNQAAISGLTTADSPNFAGLSVGTNDVARGLLYLYGHEAGGTFGGTLLCYTSADHDTVIANYGFMVKEDDLLIGPDTNVDALLLDSNDDLYVTAGSIILPASEYLNFGGVLGSGSYGVRDNAGVIEIKNSGGAWASPLSSVTAHNILSATHGDSLADTVVLGDIMHGNVTPKWARLAGNTTAVKQYLSQTGTGAVSAAPAWAAIAQADVTGLTTGDSPTFAGLTLTADLTVPNGGTGASTFTDHGVLYGQAAVAIGATAEGATGQYLAGATGAAPGWATLNQAAVAGLTTTDGPSFDHLHITGQYIYLFHDNYYGYLVGGQSILGGSYRSPNLALSNPSRSGFEGGHFIFQAGYHPTLGTTTSQFISFLTGLDAERIRITRGGEIGIGTPDPEAALDIYRASAGDALMISSPSGTGQKNCIAWTNSHGDGLVSARIGNVDDGNYGAHIVFENRTGLGSTTTERMRIKTNGCVGINDTNPGEYLDVGGNINVTGVYKVDDVQVLKEQQAAIADLNAAYVAGELDTEAEIITAINATNAKINAILAMHRTHGIIAT